MVEAWNKPESGVLQEETLLLRACKAGVYGNRIVASASSHLTFGKDVEAPLMRLVRDDRET